MPTSTNRRRVCTALTLIILLSVLLGGVYYYGYRNRPHIPLQPVPFSHITHTAPNRTSADCLHCHRGAESAAAAGMPADSTCMQCHLHILPADARLAPLHAAANPTSPGYSAEPLRWIRKAPLPAHVHFHHAQHTQAGITCTQCHPTPDKQTPHSMDSCLLCHRQHDIPTNCSACHH